nr:Crp/Fnr family transcriptional regulator [uncultured Dorea sp.]
MKLEKLWGKYKSDGDFNLQALPESLVKQGVLVEYEKNSILVSRGERPDYIYFIQEGMVAGIREYANGSTYSYFQLNSTNGSVGLLEILAGKEHYIATLSTITRVKALRIDAALVYQTIMEENELLRKCINLLADDLYKRSGNDGIMYYMSGLDRVRFFLLTYYEGHQKRAKGEVLVEAEYQDIANGIGMSIRTVGRNLQKLKETGELKNIQKKIIMGKQQYEKLQANIYS